MRSEKEIKQRLDDIVCTSEIKFETIKLLQWVLEDEPCYSVAELEKIWDAKDKGYAILKLDADCFLRERLFDFLKDSKKVQEVLG